MVGLIGFTDNPLSFKNNRALVNRTHSNDNANLPINILYPSRLNVFVENIARPLP